MLILSDNNIKKIRLSKKEWENIGKKAGWLDKESAYLPSISTNDLISWLNRIGYYAISQKGSHIKYCSDNPRPGTSKCIIVVNHGSNSGRDYNKHMLRDILKQLGIDIGYVANKGLPKKLR